jgi:hypothetical protein
MKNRDTNIGLFQGMFEKKSLPLIPGGIKMLRQWHHLMTCESYTKRFSQRE